MKQLWSPKWKSSTQPRKQRKFRHNAPLHVRHKLASANLSPALRREFGKRSMPLRKGDEVEVMRGSFRGFKGLVDRVDLKKGRIYVEGVKVKKVDGSEVLRALEHSNLRITKMVLDDKRRQKALERAPRREKKAAKKAGAKESEKKESRERPGKATGKTEAEGEEAKKPEEAKPEKRGPAKREEKIPGKEEKKKIKPEKPNPMQKEKVK